MKECDANAGNMQAYRDMYNVMEGSFDGCELRHVGRECNEEADILANIGSKKEPIPPGVFLERIKERSVKIKNPTAPTAEADDSHENSKKHRLSSSPATSWPQLRRSRYSLLSHHGQYLSCLILCAKNCLEIQSKQSTLPGDPKHSQ